MELQKSKLLNDDKPKSSSEDKEDENEITPPPAQKYIVGCFSILVILFVIVMGINISKSDDGVSCDICNENISVGSSYYINNSSPPSKAIVKKGADNYYVYLCSVSCWEKDAENLIKKKYNIK